MPQGQPEGIIAIASTTMASSYLMSRAHVSVDTSPRIICYEPAEMIAQVGMAVNRVAAMPITLREITMGDMAWVMRVAQTARGAVTPHSDAHRPTTTSTHKPHPGLPQGKGSHYNLLKHNGNELPPLGEGWGGAPNKQLFLYRQRRTFFTAKGRLLYRRGGCRHAVHDGGDGGDCKEEYSFSDCRHRHPRQGEADSHRHGFLCLCHPLIDAINGG